MRPLPVRTCDREPKPTPARRRVDALRRLRRFAVWVLVSSAWPIASVAAQQPETAAEALFRAGREASQRGDDRVACGRYRESYRLEPALGTLLNIALCELALGELSEAWRHLQTVAHALPADDARVAIADQKLAELDRRLPRLTIALANDAPPELAVWIGSLRLGAASFGIALPMDPGSYTIEVRAQDRAARQYAVTLAEGEQRMLEVDVGPALGDPGSPAPDAHGEVSVAPAPIAVAAASSLARPLKPVDTRASSSGGRRGLADVLLVTGAVAVLTSVVCGAFVLDRLATVHSHCDSTGRCDAAGLAAGRSGDHFYIAGLTSLGVAVASSGAGALLLWSEPRSEAHVGSSHPASRAWGGAWRMRF